MNSLQKLANGELKVQTLPGSDRKSTIPKSKCDSLLPQAGCDNLGDDGRNYVNIDEEYGEEDKEYNQSSLSAMFSSNMSCVESNTYGSSVADLKDLDRDEIRLFENYKFKDKSDISNSLLIARYRDKIVQAINSNCVLLITGATGCGKSTQVPQYILDDCMSRKKYCNIIVTQPRRIAAISVSKQVNKERGWKSGLLVGYQVGRKKDLNPSTTKIVYCTAGILLQKIIKAKSLSEYTHIILDEVHERTLEMDFLLLVIKKLMRSLSSRSQSTRIILMSATANPYKLQEYFSNYYSQSYNRFEGATLINVDGKSNYSITKHYLDDLYDVIPATRRMEFTKPQIDDEGYLTAIELVKAFDNMEIKGVIKKNSSVLIFLPGIFEIEEIHRQMEREMDKYNYKWILVPLHSSITSEEQNRVFEIPPLHYRKIILSTNIAESSITVSDISYVIDFCLMKQLKNEMRSNYSMLIMEWASKSNCEQRAGRVGRVSEGRVYRLVPNIMFKQQFNDHEVPEMNRCSLSRVVLMSKLLDMGTPKQLLATALDPPSFKNIALTILTLKQVGALLPTVNGVISSMDGDLTFLGKVMAHLPLEPPMAKLIYFGHIFNILSEAIIMACGLSMKSLFSQPFNKRLDAYTQKLSWANNSCSDPIAYINAFQSWLEKKPEFDRNRNLEKSWAYNNFIQLSAIRELYDLVDDVTDRLRRSFGIVVNSGAMKWNKSEEKAMACKVILGGAFYPNYFIRGTSNAYSDEHHVLKLLDDHDPYRSVYFVGFPKDQPSILYKEAVENMFPEKFVGKPIAFFCKSSNKVFVEFPISNINNSVHKNLQGNGNQLIPGNICFGVYVAMKMYHLKYDFKIPLLQPEDAKHKVEIYKKLAAKKKCSGRNISPFQKSILEEIETDIKNIPITISYFESIDCFWAQLNDKMNKVKMLEIWQTANGIVNLVNAKPSDIKDGNIYIVNYEEDKYRAMLISVPPKHQAKYKFFLIDFGQVVELILENVFNISNLNEDVKSLVNVPALSFKCKFAKIQPLLHGNLENNWSDEANNFVRLNGMWPKSVEGTIYSIVNDVVSFEDLVFTTKSNDPISMKEYLIKNKLANHSDETFASKMDHNKRSNTHKTVNKENQSNELCLNLKSPTIDEAYQMHHLKGPYSPLEMSVHGINHNCVSKLVKIESQSVNSVLLDSCPNDYHERLFVAGNVCMTESDKLTLWDSTMMPNIPGMPTIICLLFSPCVEIRYNDSFTKMIGAICGLGYEDSSRPLFKDNDIEITFDTIVDDDLLSKINIIRMLLNKCVNPNDPEGPGDIFDITLYLQQSLLELLSIPFKFKSPEPYSNKYMWARIPKSRLRSPYKEEGSPIMHPMAGSDVYKLIWNAKLSSKLTLKDCRDLYFKLDKIKRLKDGFSMAYFSSEMKHEDLSCPLCYLTFDNKTSMEMHFKNYQHIERYQLARRELFVSYKGPVSDIQNL